MMWQRTILTTVVQCTLWLRQALRASAHEFSVPGEGVVSAMDGVTSRFVLSRAFKAVREPRSLTVGALLGLVVVFVVHYLRSPWRKLPPRPRGLPIIGNALQAMDQSWLVSKDCKERFGEYASSSTTHGNTELDARQSQERSCTLTWPDSPLSCSTASNQLTNSSSAVQPLTLAVPDASWYRRSLARVYCSH